MHHHGSDCLRLRVDVVGHKGSAKSQDKSKSEEREKEEEKMKFNALGGVHNPANRLPAGKDLIPTNWNHVSDQINLGVFTIPD